MLTFTCEKYRPALSVISHESGKTLAIPTELGRAIEDEIRSIPLFHPEIRLYDFVIMPDHVHIILFVERQLERPLGMTLSGFVGACNSCYSEDTLEKLFTHGFHDRIINRPGQLDMCRKYVMDNPRRLAMKRANPDLFRRYNHLVIEGREFAAYGNIFLLRDFDRQQVVVHRSDTVEIRRSNEHRWMASAANGGVLVSPFISPAEKMIRDRALDFGCRLIILRNEGFEERFKPQGREFDLCADGRLLLLAPWPDRLRRSALSRAEALELNELAAKIATFNGEMKILSLTLRV